MSDNDTITVDITAPEAGALAQSIMVLQETGIMQLAPREVRRELHSLVGKMMAAIDAQKLTDWEKGVK